MKEHEKFIAFCLLGGALVMVAMFAYLHPIPVAETGSSQIINTIVGALTLAFGGAANALFRITDTVKVDNPPSQPVPTTDQSAPVAAQTEVPDYAS